MWREGEDGEPSVCAVVTRCRRGAGQLERHARAKGTSRAASSTREKLHPASLVRARHGYGSGRPEVVRSSLRQREPVRESEGLADGGGAVVGVQLVRIGRGTACRRECRYPRKVRSGGPVSLAALNRARTLPLSPASSTPSAPVAFTSTASGAGLTHHPLELLHSPSPLFPFWTIALAPDHPSVLEFVTVHCW